MIHQWYGICNDQKWNQNLIFKSTEGVTLQVKNGKYGGVEFTLQYTKMKDRGVLYIIPKKIGRNLYVQLVVVEHNLERTVYKYIYRVFMSKANESSNWGE